MKVFTNLYLHLKLFNLVKYYFDQGYCGWFLSTHGGKRKCIQFFVENLFGDILKWLL
jgi:hypothetical protein